MAEAGQGMFANRLTGAPVVPGVAALVSFFLVASTMNSGKP
jgi:hypothetical protein